MALTGTLKDFGIAEILQLIGQQAKSGVLHLATDGEEIHVVLAEGAVVSAESARRKQKERLGTMLVRAELISRDALARALQVQSRTLRRLGDILVELELVTKQDLKEMTTLQTTETIYRLFEWKTGTYDFEAGAVEWDRETVSPLRAEALLMEGFRRVDEWPMVRRKIVSPAMTFVRRALPPDADASVGAAERRVHALAEPGRTVEKLVDLSRLGEFETSKALMNLVNLGCLEALPAPRRSAAAGVSAYARSWRRGLRRGASGLAATALLAGALAGGAWLAADRHLAATRAGPPLEDGAARRLLARHQLARLSGALEVWRLERGAYPERLSALVEDGLAEPADLRRPWSEEYHYRRTPDGGFVLLPPLP
jgi:hypothetical protein